MPWLLCDTFASKKCMHSITFYLLCFKHYVFSILRDAEIMQQKQKAAKEKASGPGK